MRSCVQAVSRKRSETVELKNTNAVFRLVHPVVSQKQRNKALTLAHAQTIHYTSN